METAQLTDAILNKIDSFQIKGLRKKRGKKHTYWDRNATNYNILETASSIVKETKRRPNKKDNKWGPKPFGDFSGAEKLGITYANNKKDRQALTNLTMVETTRKMTICQRTRGKLKSGNWERKEGRTQ